MPARSRLADAAPVLLSGMAQVTGTSAAVAALPEPLLAEIATLCAACPRTDACLQWLVTRGPGPAIPASDLCPNHGIFATLAPDH